MRQVSRSAPAPADLGVALIGVPPGADLELELRLESVVEGVLVSGTVTADVVGECGRCLEPVTDRLSVRVQELYAYPGDEPVEAAADEDEEARMDGDLLDLEPAVRDALVLALPMTPLCRSDCSGLCPGCGERLDDLPDDHGHGTADRRWSALEALLSPRAPAAGRPERPAAADPAVPDPAPEET